MINELRVNLSLPPANIQLQVRFPELVDSQQTIATEQNPTQESVNPPPSKKPRRLRGTVVKSKRSLSFDSPGQTKIATAEVSDAVTQTPEIKVSVHDRLTLIIII